MKRSLSLGLLVTAFSGITLAQGPQIVRFQGGPAAGMAPGPVVSRNGRMALVELSPSEPNASPVGEPNLATIDALLNAYRSNLSLPRSAVADNATSMFCEHEIGPDCSRGPFEAFPIGAGYIFNTPYQLANGQVRIEWLRDGHVKYLSFVTLVGAKVSEISTVTPLMPMALPQDLGAGPNG